MLSLGLSKTLYNSGISIISNHNNNLVLETILTERLTRIKSSGNWPQTALIYFQKNYYEDHDISVYENRDVTTPKEFEDSLNNVFPFDHMLGKLNLTKFLSDNSSIKFLGHHYAHALSAYAFSPFKKALILVIDGAGSKFTDIPSNEYQKAKMINLQSTDNQYEEYSLFSLEDHQLICLEKKWQQFVPLNNYDQKVTFGIGITYETVAKFIFGNISAAGKVMGLSSFGTALNIDSNQSLLEYLDWDRAFKGNNKKEWEQSPHLKYYQDIAATVQKLHEQQLEKIIVNAKQQYPDFNYLIITGGSALNVIANSKLYNKKIFKKIYIPPAPNDQGISTGLAFQTIIEREIKKNITNFSYQKQTSSFGPLNSIPCQEEIKSTFQAYNIYRPKNLAVEVASLLNNNNIIALFSGRSEVGPRSLGNRSIIANPKIHNLKEILNTTIKFRESFRPYGASCLFEYKNTYFHLDQDQEIPFMSFSVPVKDKFKEQLKSITHIDGTSRIQTVNQYQNPTFYNIIQEFGKLSDIYCVLNTSLNIMGEPIIETIQDLKNFFDRSPIQHIVVEDFIITKHPYDS